MQQHLPLVCPSHLLAVIPMHFWFGWRLRSGVELVIMHVQWRVSRLWIPRYTLHVTAPSQETHTAKRSLHASPRSHWEGVNVWCGAGHHARTIEGIEAMDSSLHTPRARDTQPRLSLQAKAPRSHWLAASPPSPWPPHRLPPLGLSKSVRTAAWCR